MELLLQLLSCDCVSGFDFATQSGGRLELTPRGIASRRTDLGPRHRTHFKSNAILSRRQQRNRSQIYHRRRHVNIVASEFRARLERINKSKQVRENDSRQAGLVKNRPSALGILISEIINT